MFRKPNYCVELKMKVFFIILLTGVTLVAGGFFEGLLLHWLITNWLLQFGIAKEISLWLCVMTSIYLGSLFSLSK